MNSLNFSVVIVLFFTAILTYSFRLLYRPAARSRRHSKNLYRMSADIEDIIDLTSVAEDEAEAVKKSSKTISLNSILLDDEFKSGFTEKLLAWYRTNRRSMPWRGDPPESRPITAYGVWISEVMLQQTRVETVIAYWNRWMDRFPDVSTLAAATPEEVNQMWAGLGYYRRAQNLLKGAQYLAQKHNSTLPNTLAELLGIPGVGVYTAGAIGSIVHNLPIPAVDGNVYRVLGRVCKIQHELGSSMLGKVCSDVSTQLVKVCDGQAGVYTQAMMELGATVCKPTSPKCSDCPVRMHCRAYQENVVATYPIKSSKKSVVKDVNVYAHVVYTKQNPYLESPSALESHSDVWYLLFKRPAKGLLANQWEFPSRAVYVEATDSVPAVAKGKKNGSLPSTVDGSAKTYSVDDLRAYISSHTPLSWSSPASIRSISTVPALAPPLVHIFSHEKHCMHLSMEEVAIVPGDGLSKVKLEHIKAQPQDTMSPESTIDAANDDTLDDVEEDADAAVVDAEGSERVARWLTSNELRLLGISTQCKKVLERIEEALGVHTDKKKKRRATTDKSERTAAEVSSGEEDVVVKAGNAFDIMKRASSNMKLVKKKKS